jgi:hypothetical protein
MSEIHRAAAPAHDDSAPSAKQSALYVPFYRSLIHEGARYRTVSKDAQLAFVTLKLIMEFENIAKHVSWPAEIADNSALTEVEARAGLKELAAAGMVRWDGKVLWIVQGLAYDPSMRGKISPTFATGVARTLRNLPDCEVTQAFRAHYAAVLKVAEEAAKAKAREKDRKEGRTPTDTPTDTPMGEPSREGSGVRCKVNGGVEKKEGKKGGTKPNTTRKPRKKKAPASSAPAASGDWAKRMSAAAYLNGFDVSEERLAKDFGTLVTRHGGDRVVAVWQQYLETTQPQFYGVLSFRERFQIFADSLDNGGETSDARKQQQSSEPDVETTFVL